jgi:hypothetical protein
VYSEVGAAQRVALIPGRSLVKLLRVGASDKDAVGETLRWHCISRNTVAFLPFDSGH